MAKYDLPATIYYILNQTGDEQLFYVGHSQGTAIAFARFSEDQELASRVKHLMALAPIGRVGNMTSPPLLLLVPFAKEIKSRSDVYLSHVPAGASALTLMQWVQGVKSGQFQHFDYGEQENLVKYGQKTPPLYNPRKVKVPVAIFRGGRDWLADTSDVEWLLPQLNVTHDIYVPFYQHLDMTYGFDAVTRMYKYIVNIVMGKD
ncbi:lipase [Elysia marginata]|uniref:Lipase n=1 Tax=Elysia marginata TaxID=1093978 RepID=A0AAV4G5Y6_9GAST|nr:lipase [Elysia marginata]